MESHHSGTSVFQFKKKPLFKEPLFKGYLDLRDKFLKISIISGEILGKFDEFDKKKRYFEITFKKKFVRKK